MNNKYCKDCMKYNIVTGCEYYYEDVDQKAGKKNKMNCANIMTNTFPDGHDCQNFVQKNPQTKTKDMLVEDDNVLQMTYGQKRKLAKYGDWNIHCIQDSFKGNADLMDIHTHGMEQYGLLNLSMVLNIGKDNIAELINNIAWMMIQGEKFNLDVLHYLDEEEGKPVLFRFKLEPFICHGEHTLRICVYEVKGQEVSDVNMALQLLHYEETERNL